MLFIFIPGQRKPKRISLFYFFAENPWNSQSVVDKQPQNVTARTEVSEVLAGCSTLSNISALSVEKFPTHRPANIVFHNDG